jgi:uncharacterized paraquat-inducible protein A
MPGDLDDILTQVDCPTCGATINVPFGQLRLHKAAGCGCGTLLRLEDETPLAAVQRLIDEADPLSASND